MAERGGTGRAGRAGPIQTAAPKVFICYRREETAGYAGRLYDAAVARLGDANVFMDVDLAPGLDFVQRITDAVGACKVLLVVMGPRWATVTHDGEGPRIADPEDYVRLEVETALRRSEVTVIPVLVGGARMPDREELPLELQALTRRNALELSDGRWRYDVGRLMDALDAALPEFAALRDAAAPPERRGAAKLAAVANRAPGRLLLEAVLIAGGTALLAGALAFTLFTTPAQLSSNLWRFIALPVARRALVWAMTGVALALWLTIRRGDRDFVRRGMQGLLVGALAGALGGAIFGALTNLPERDPFTGSPVSQYPFVHGSSSDWLDVGSVAVTGALIGMLIGSRWLPTSRGIGCVGGAIGGALVELIFIPWHTTGTWVNGLRFGITAAAITGVAVAFLLAVAARSRAASRDGAASVAQPSP